VIGKRTTCLWAATALAAALFAGCGPSDPYEAALKERTRWTVELLSFTPLEDGSAIAGFRLSGPVNNRLKQLTVRLDIQGADGDVIESVWHTFDVSDAKRGVTVERSVKLPATAVPGETLAMDPVLQPGEDDIPRIPELASLRDRPR